MSADGGFAAGAADVAGVFELCPKPDRGEAHKGALRHGIVIASVSTPHTRTHTHRHRCRTQSRAHRKRIESKHMTRFDNRNTDDSIIRGNTFKFMTGEIDWRLSSTTAPPLDQIALFTHYLCVHIPGRNVCGWSVVS